MKYLGVILILLASLGYSQGTKTPQGSFTKKPYAVPLGLPTTGKIDTSWITGGSGGPGTTTNTTIYISAIQEGILANAVLSGKSTSFAHPFADTSYVVNFRGYKSSNTIATGVKKYADSVVFYPADTAYVEWMARDTSSVSGTVQNGLTTGTSVTFAHPFATTDYVVMVNGIKNGSDVAVIVSKGTTSMTLTPAENGTAIMWSVGGYTQ